jgi:hypothetical protein
LNTPERLITKLRGARRDKRTVATDLFERVHKKFYLCLDFRFKFNPLEKKILNNANETKQG